MSQLYSWKVDLMRIWLIFKVLFDNITLQMFRVLYVLSFQTLAFSAPNECIQVNQEKRFGRTKLITCFYIVYILSITFGQFYKHSFNIYASLNGIVYIQYENLFQIIKEWNKNELQIIHNFNFVFNNILRIWSACLWTMLKCVSFNLNSIFNSFFFKF